MALGYYIGLDLGQQQDYSALVVLETADPAPPRTYAGRHLQRWPLGTSYPTVAQEVAAMAESLALAQPGPVVLAVDAGGVGRPVVDMLRREPMPHVRLLPIVITGGRAITVTDGCWHVPKRTLVESVAAVLATGRLKLARDLPGAGALMRELQSFRRQISPTGHDRYGAWGIGAVDDLTLALCYAVWTGDWRGTTAAKVMVGRGLYART